jgi:hypothetical protein
LHEYAFETDLLLILAKKDLLLIIEMILLFYVLATKPYDFLNMLFYLCEYFPISMHKYYKFHTGDILDDTTRSRLQKFFEQQIGIPSGRQG